MARPKGSGETPKYTIRLSRELREDLERLAVADRRELSKYIVKALEDHVAEATSIADAAFASVGRAPSPLLGAMPRPRGKRAGGRAAKTKAQDEARDPSP